MSTLAFWTVAVLTAAKTGVIPVRKPFEWVGELATGILALAVAGVCALAVHLYVGDFGEVVVHKIGAFWTSDVGIGWYIERLI